MEHPTRSFRYYLEPLGNFTGTAAQFEVAYADQFNKKFQLDAMRFAVTWSSNELIKIRVFNQDVLLYSYIGNFTGYNNNFDVNGFQSILYSNKHIGLFITFKIIPANKLIR